MRCPEFIFSYVKALKQEAARRNLQAEVLQDIKCLVTFLGGNQSVAAFFKCAGIANANKQKALELVTKLLNFSDLFADFLKLMLQNKRIMFMELMLSEAQEEFLNKNTVSMQLLAANESDAEVMLNALRAPQYQNLSISTQIRPNLIGGFVVVLNHNTCYDASISGKLKRIQAFLMQQIQ